MVASDACGSPAAIVSRGITLVELKAKVRVPAHVQDGHTKWTLPCTMCACVCVCVCVYVCMYVCMQQKKFIKPFSQYCIYLRIVCMLA